MKVFIENEAGSDQKNLYNEKTLEYKKTITVSREYPFPYGFILETTSGDGDNLDCFIITDKKLKTGEIVECEPIGMMEQTENGKEDHNILAKLNEEEISISPSIQEKLTEFVSHVFDHRAGKVVTVGRFLDKIAAEEYIGKCMQLQKMDYIQKVKQDSIDEFGSDVTRKRYERDANVGFWESEEILIKKYFQQNSKILDIGCGSGRTTFPLFKLGYYVIGVDITPMMIEIAKENAKAQNLDIKFIVGDATNLDFSDNVFDGAIFANNGWAQIPGKQFRQKSLNEIYRVLKPGGIYIFTSHKRYYSLKTILFWLGKRIFKSGAIDFGDVFFRRYAEGKKLKQKQFLHLSSVNEVKQQILDAGFSLVDFKGMGELSKKDAESRRASLWNGFNSFKSPIFYVCQK